MTRISYFLTFPSGKAHDSRALSEPKRRPQLPAGHDPLVSCLRILGRDQRPGDTAERARGERQPQALTPSPEPQAPAHHRLTYSARRGNANVPATSSMMLTWQT